MGEVRELNPGDWLYPHVQVRSYMLVEAGRSTDSPAQGQWRFPLPCAMPQGT